LLWCVWSWTSKNSMSDFLWTLLHFFSCRIEWCVSALFASDRKELQLRVSYFEHSKTDSDSPFTGKVGDSDSQCQQQHYHHSYFSKHEHCAFYTESFPLDEMDSLFLVMKLAFIVFVFSCLLQSCILVSLSFFVSFRWCWSWSTSSWFDYARAWKAEDFTGHPLGWCGTGAEWSQDVKLEYWKWAWMWVNTHSVFEQICEQILKLWQKPLIRQGHFNGI